MVAIFTTDEEATEGALGFGSRAIPADLMNACSSGVPSEKTIGWVALNSVTASPYAFDKTQLREFM